MTHSALFDMLTRAARSDPDAVALLAPIRTPLTYARLVDHVRGIGDALRERGFGTDSCIAVVLPNGPEPAAAFFGIGTSAVCAPLNPAYQAPELEFFLSDLEADALLTTPALDSPAREVARRLGIPVLEIDVDADEPAGWFRLSDAGARPGGSHAASRAEGTALVLHTSGTTSKPKQVQLTQENLVASAANIRETLQLSPSDRCLNVMPLFHIHGLMAAVTASLSAGASVVCTPGFYVTDFFDWMEALQPTWYTAVPTMHQSIAARADGHRETIARTPLRFVRSSSSSLQPSLMRELEGKLGVPVIEAYGMTEASHQMASNPLPPDVRKPGAVGRPTGLDIAILNDRNEPLPAGETGEIAIRGDSVTPGYVNNPGANVSAFTDGWFRTGDEGYFDVDGYLFITGRLKEQINRGGEKIAPREIDEVILDHPAVAQVLAFAVPDERLGEDVGVAVVRRDGRHVSAAEIRNFAAARLAPFKVPREVVFVDEIPKGPTGKLQRIGLAERLGVTSRADSPETDAPAAARTDVERVLQRLWEEVLDVPVENMHDQFLDLGGDSMLAARLAGRVNEEFEVHLALHEFFDAASIAAQGALIEQIRS